MAHFLRGIETMSGRQERDAWERLVKARSSLRGRCSISRELPCTAIRDRNPDRPPLPRGNYLVSCNPPIVLANPRETRRARERPIAYRAVSRGNAN